MATVIPIQEIHMFDVGLSFIVTMSDADGIVDLSSASLVQYKFQKPDGTMLIVPASLLNDGTDGKITYSTSETDLDQSGTWKHQVYAEIGPDKKWSNIAKFKVYPNLPLEI